jgi:effector-binding domain-containing protein
MLGNRAADGFSGTAGSGRRPRYGDPRPHRGELDAVGRDDRSVAAPIGGRGLADDVVEGPAEGPEAGEPDVQADIRDAAVRLAQQEHGPLHPATLQVAVRGLPEGGTEASAEVGFGHVRDGGDRTHVERLRVRPIHRIAGAEQPAVQVLDVSTHPATLAHVTRRGIGSRIGVAPGGAPFVIYHSEPRDGAIDLEVCAPVGPAIPAPEGWQVRELPAGTFATLVHVGPYDTVGVSYERISRWIADHGFEIAGPPREVYLDPPDTPPDRTRTIIEFPVTGSPVPLPAG